MAPKPVSGLTAEVLTCCLLICLLLFTRIDPFTAPWAIALPSQRA